MITSTAATGGAGILLVDDESAVREVVRHALLAEGYEVTVAANGREALARFREQDFDLVVTDLIMPDMEGIQMILKMQALEPGIPVIAMSGGFSRGQGDFLPLARRLGARAVLAKPFGYQELMGAIREALEEAAV